MTLKQFQVFCAPVENAVKTNIPAKTAIDTYLNISHSITQATDSTNVSFTLVSHTYDPLPNFKKCRGWVNCDGKMHPEQGGYFEERKKIEQYNKERGYPWQMWLNDKKRSI